ncbi:MAG TPA: diguanylate cyclase response regulator [Cyanobacteria bacterium UBA8803]|nr:diguanylate cyclase response regulator [Cyanobacteria bacterium UBA9273]HBL60654.1 diguanylate cyclase response regulator [Cyanobacteria bacterium UBA8803]
MNEPDVRQKTPLILIVDDEKTLRLLLRRAMEQEGYQVIEVCDGEECLAACQQQLPDIVLLDAMMPVIDGFACCAQLQHAFGEQCPPVLMITGLNNQESVDRAFEAGATDYITKPIHWAVLRQRVRRLLQTRWAMAELRRKIEHERLLMAQLEAANRELQRLASMDGLTQIANRRVFDECLQQEWKRLSREQAPLSLILCDIDFFKTYNDTYGHQAGDECLKQVAHIIQQTVKRPADLVARYGGEEFVVILPNTEIKGAVHIAQEIRSELRAKAIAHAGSRVSNFVTLSCGVANMIPHPGTSPHQLIAEADRALYQAKVEGRDRVVSALVGTELKTAVS